MGHISGQCTEPKRLQIVNKQLQKSNLNISVAVQLPHKALRKFDDFFKEAKKCYVQLEADKNTLMIRSAITLAYMEEKQSYCQNTILTPVLGSLIANLNSRMDCYVQIDEKFSFLIKLNELNTDQISTACRKIAFFYENDLDAN